MNTLWTWWLSPLSGATSHDIAPWTYWHARAMVMAWGVLLPLGILIARYFKVLPSQDWPARLDNKFWWHAHRSLQWAGVLLASLGLCLVWPHGQNESPLGRVHMATGLLVMLLGWLQILGGLLRGSKGGPGEPSLRGDHYDMTPQRIWFERLHKGLGWLSLLLALASMGAGLVLADAPRWMPLLLLLWWGLLAALAWRWQRQGRCIDTYQAIWGPDLQHPGNRLQPIGLGIRRPLETSRHG